MDVPYEKQFHFHDGTAAASLEDLATRLQAISYQEFYRHVNPDKNDFASWIRHVLKEEALADELERVTSIVETVEIINDFLHPPPVLQPRTDLQSRIQHEILGDRPPPQSTQATDDFRIIQEHAPPKAAEHPPEHAHMVLKDFMYGLVFGLIVGIILGRILAF